MRQTVGRLAAVLAILGLAGCPGLSDEPSGEGYDPERGNAFDMPLSISDQRTLDLDPSTLPAAPAPCMPPWLGAVTNVVDGDTIDVVPIDSLTGAPVRVRMIGVDTPEIDHGPDRPPAEICGREAHGFSELLRGRYVWLTYDAECQDRTDTPRDLAYVWIGAGDSTEGAGSSDMWNRQLLRRGFATTLAIAPNESFAATFEADAAIAEAAGLVLWTPSSCLALPIP